MARTIETQVYQFDELSDRAKEGARDWWRQRENEDSHWHESTIEDATTIGAMLGIKFRDRPVKLMNGNTRYDPCIWWSGFSSQGDGACFEGTYLYEKCAAKKVKEYAPQDTELHHIAEALQDVQRRHFYQLRADVQHRGYHYHSGCTSIDVSNPETGADVPQEVENLVADEMRAFMDWIYRQLRDNYEWNMADEQVDDNIRANEYEFTENGKRA